MDGAYKKNQKFDIPTCGAAAGWLINLGSSPGNPTNLSQFVQTKSVSLLVTYKFQALQLRPNICKLQGTWRSRFGGRATAVMRRTIKSKSWLNRRQIQRALSRNPKHQVLHSRTIFCTMSVRSYMRINEGVLPKLD